MAGKSDAEHAAVLRRILHDRPGLVTRERAAIERAIELLSLDWDMIPVEREELQRLVMERRNKP